MQLQELYSKKFYTELEAHCGMQLHVKQINRILHMFGISMNVGTITTKIADDPTHWLIEFNSGTVEEQHCKDDNGRLISMHNAFNDLQVAILCNKTISERNKNG